ncbi:MAG: glycosyltransferase family 2 protein [Candidatus Levybacteria bacterium]|nr:glycosyltransferase family 2 protein [Candidatus Levybacteria bacterium]
MVSIIILSYNTKDLLKECLQALFTHLNGVAFEAIVFDNASKDASAAMVKKEFPKVRIIESRENLGFAKGINAAAKHVRGEFLLFLNSDAMILDNKLEEMVDQLKDHTDIGVIGGNLLNKDETTSASFGRFYNLPEVINLLFFSKKSTITPSNGFTQVDWVSGGFMLVRRETFEKIGGFDEHFFMYIEDMEFCYRLRKAGMRTLYYAPARAKHIGQGSSNRTFAIVNIYKGILYFYRKQRPLHEYFVVQLLLGVKAVSAYLFGLLSGNMYLRSTYAQALRVLI